MRLSPELEAVIVMICANRKPKQKKPVELSPDAQEYIEARREAARRERERQEREHDRRQREGYGDNVQDAQRGEWVEAFRRAQEQRRRDADDRYRFIPRKPDITWEAMRPNNSENARFNAMLRNAA